MERIMIGGQVVDVPAKVSAQGRAAVAQWHEAQLQAANLPHILIESDQPQHAACGPAPVEVPPEVAKKSKKAQQEWFKDELARRAKVDEDARQTKVHALRVAEGFEEPVAPPPPPPPTSGGEV